jgi:Phage gp6-like head-tail connector protein
MITKTKSLYPVSVEEVKQHLRIDLDNNEDDDYLSNNIIKSATRKAENYIDKDIAYTTNTFTAYDFSASSITIPEGNLISITDVSINGTLYTDYELQISKDRFILDWDYSIGGDDYTFVSHFITGYDPDDVPEEIKQAIMIYCGDLYDMERSSYTFSGIKKSDVAERCLMTHRAIRW